MKSQVNALLSVVRGTCKDILAAYPALEGCVSKDLGRLALYCQTRGIGCFTLDLPHLESILLRGLEDGRLSLKGPMSHRVSKRVQVPRLFSGLWLRVFDRDASLKQDADVNALYFLRQLLAVGKKLEIGCSPNRLASTVGGYHDIERSLRNPSLAWTLDDLDPVGLHKSLHLVQACDGSFSTVESTLPLFRAQAKNKSEAVQHQEKEDRVLLQQIQKVADLLIGSIEPFDPISYSDWLNHQQDGIGFRHGPGAVADRLKNWEKSRFPYWPAKLSKTFPPLSCISIFDKESLPRNHEVASRLIAVPKTRKGPRLIAAEPTSHQWCQQLILHFLFDQCSRGICSSFIDFKDQSKSGDMVLRNSLSRELATVDLSDASDRLTCWTVERIFRKNFSLLTALHAARTRYLRDDISKVPTFLKLRKFASQGTATTFPVMSLSILCIALGSSIEGNVTIEKIRRLRNQVRVFGDDVLLPKRGFARFVRASHILDLKINVSKSYVDGYFRESCGVDGFRGYDVTPVKLTTVTGDSPSSCQSLLDESNNLFRKGLWHTAQACFELLPSRYQRDLRVVGPSEEGLHGLASFVGSKVDHLRRRWNPHYQRYEVRTWLTLTSSTSKPRDGYHVLLDFVSRRYCSGSPRVVSNYTCNRKARIGFHWEPLDAISCSHGDVFRKSYYDSPKHAMWQVSGFPSSQEVHSLGDDGIL